MTEKIILPSRLHDADEADTTLIQSWDMSTGSSYTVRTTWIPTGEGDFTFEMLDIPPPEPSHEEPIRAGRSGSSWIRDFLFCLVVISIVVTICLVIMGLYNV